MTGFYCSKYSMARRLSTKKRTQIKQSKQQRFVLEHQRQIDGGDLPVHEFTLTEHVPDDAVYPIQVYMAKREPIVKGFPRDSMTAVVMQMLRDGYLEGARL